MRPINNHNKTSLMANRVHYVVYITYNCRFLTAMESFILFTIFNNVMYFYCVYTWWNLIALFYRDALLFS